jgi:histidine triad (HIT) family protein
MPARRPPEKSNRNCIFCDLVQGSAEVSICYEDDVALAFMDVQPVNAGHVLVIPRDHYETLRDIPRAVGWHLFHVATRLIPVIQAVAGADDMNIIVNSGPAAGQNVFHYHIHLIPRKKGDGFDVPLPFPGSDMPHRHMLDAMAVRIGSALRVDPAQLTPASGVRVVNPADRIPPAATAGAASSRTSTSAKAAPAAAKGSSKAAPPANGAKGKKSAAPTRGGKR